MTNKLNLDPLIELTSQKKRVNSRRKGATFERELVTKLNKKFDTKEFSRTPGSGAFATTHTQAKRDADNSKKQWLLIYKKTRKKALIVSDINQFPIESYIEVPHLKVSIYLLDDVLLLDNSLFII